MSEAAGTATQEPCARLVASWRKIAGEDIRVIVSGAMTYAVGSELATLRLFHAYRNDPAPTDAAWSQQLGAWVFTLQRRFDRQG